MMRRNGHSGWGWRPGAGGALMVARMLALMVALIVASAHAAVPAVPAAPEAVGSDDTPRPASNRSAPPMFPPKLRVGVLADGWPPFDVLDDDRLTGFSASYLRLLVGPGVELVPQRFADMQQLLAAACAGAVDVVMSVARTPAREDCLAFTIPYLNGSTAFVTRSGDTGALAPGAPPGRSRIATERGFALESLLRKRFSRAPVELYATTPEALHAVETGAADIYAGFAPVVRYQLATRAYPGLRIAYEERMQTRGLRFAVPRSNTALRDQLNAALDVVKPTAAAELRERWLGREPRPSQFVLSDRERGDLAPLAGLIDRALRAMPAAESQRIRDRWVNAGTDARQRWGVSALRLLPLLIVFGVVLLITLRAYVLLQREMRRRQRAESVLARQVELQRTMMEMIPYPFATRDLENRYLAVNHAFEEATGLSRVDVLGRAGIGLAPWGGENSRRVDEMYRQAIGGHGTQHVELELEGANGERRHGIFWTRLCRDGRDEPFCVLGAMIDITEVRRAELRARETERLLSDLTRWLPAVVFLLRRTPDGRYTFPYIGGDMRRLLGDDGDELKRVDAPDMLRVHPRDRRRLVARLERSAHELVPVHMEFRYLLPAGQIWVRAEFVARREDDRTVVWSGCAFDVSTERARADELARARDMAQAASRAKDRFLAMMSHEIRTPMNGVLGLIEVLERTPLDVEQSEMVGMVQESAGALLQILDDVLDFAKIEAGRLAIESEPFDVRELVDRAVGLLAARAHEKGLRLSVDVEPNVAAMLRGDTVRLRQILFNLLGNAIKFTEQGEVRVIVTATDVDRDDADANANANANANAGAGANARQRLALSVEDTGIGIAPDVQAQLFEPFAQAESSTTRRFGGTGLGLAICRRLAWLMGGRLALQSVVGRGTRMTLSIELDVHAHSGASDALTGRRALVECDDERTAAALMHFGAALGMAMMRVAPSDREERQRTSVDQVDLVFRSEDSTGTLPATGAPVIRLSATPSPTGYRVTDAGVLLGTNPISWCGMGAACAAALGGQPSRVRANANAATDATSAVPEREQELAAGRLILVAEDHPVNQELIRRQLALLGFACDVASDGAKARAALERTRYGCLITDCNMPNLSGYELVRWLRKRELESGSRALPVIGITASTSSDDLRRCREAGMDDCLVKPTRLATLRDHLARRFDVGQDTPLPQRADTADTADDARKPPAGPLDIDRMVRVWGSMATVKTLLGLFVSAVREDLHALLPLLDDGNPQRLREWHHRLAGAVGVLHYPALFEVLEAYRGQIDRQGAAQLREEGLLLISTCNGMLDDIEQQATMLAPV